MSQNETKKIIVVENRRQELICRAVEKFLMTHGDTWYLHKGEESKWCGYCDECYACEGPVNIMDTYKGWWCEYRINSDDRFPHFLRAVDKCYDYGTVEDEEVRDAAEILAHHGKLSIYQYGEGNTIFGNDTRYSWHYENPYPEHAKQ